MAKKVKVAAIQMRVTLSPKKNLERLLFFLEKAAKNKVDIACFPEDCILEHPFQTKRKDDSLKEIQRMCKKLKIHCIFGTYIKEKNKFLNCAFLIDDKGEIKYRYEKIHLWKGDKKEGVSHGRQDIPIKTKFGKIGIIICYDINFPELIKKLAKGGAWIVFCPTFDVLTKKEKRDLKRYKKIFSLAAPAIKSFENEVFIVVADVYTKPKIATGVSVICSPRQYKILKKIDNKEGMIMADLNPNEVKKMRKEEDLLKY
ncbi:MAG: carbon-nitrogen hydrolase family protein [Candidatus Pacebacteria bacterium]|nr:carbon-nitrogen hydrolase family protein [Candidatus Paceibacterota bacterium]